ncbi:GvpL/GvpF family gas vesicle protein [Streptomyces sp. NBC_00344]|uniref:GvpL/GvpF family gas vesicle protein n=1 Tax=Streptomyces sp. NBC_00344 TaxID=2975720 RepID=UPI002E21789B
MTVTSTHSDRPGRDRGGLPTAHLTYVYAVCRSDGPAAAVAEHTGGYDEGGPLRLLTAGELYAVVQDVPSAAFCEEALRRRLADPGELERCVRTHHEVVSAAATGGPVVPLPLATLYHDDARAGEVLWSSAQRFRQSLDRVEGRTEWAVKVHALRAARRPEPDGGPPHVARETERGRRDSRHGTDTPCSSEAPHAPNAPPSPQAPHSPGASDTGRPGSGRDYLSRVRERQRAAEQRHDEALQAADRVDRALRLISAASVRRRPHSTEITGKERPQIMNAAYLIAKEREHELVTAVDSLRRRPEFRHVDIDLSGPWVPYSFTEGGDEG